MLNSIGVDLVQISELKRLMDLGQAFEKYTFSKAELVLSDEAPNRAEFLAGRFAAKEAVFKAVVPFTRSKEFDMGLVETLMNPDGSPYIEINAGLQQVLHEAGIESLHISISHDGDYAIAFVAATRKTPIG